MDRDPEKNRVSPEGSATGVSIGCGALIGVVIGVPLALSSVIAGSGWLSAAELIGCVTVGAVLSWRFGDRFYETFAKWWPWL